MASRIELYRMYCRRSVTAIPGASDLGLAIPFSQGRFFFLSRLGAHLINLGG